MAPDIPITRAHSNGSVECFTMVKYFGTCGTKHLEAPNSIIVKIADFKRSEGMIYSMSFTFWPREAWVCSRPRPAALPGFQRRKQFG